jgi:hypothetical protein
LHWRCEFKAEHSVPPIFFFLMGYCCTCLA